MSRSATGATSPSIPALAWNMSTEPNRSSAAAKNRSVSSALVTSAATGSNAASPSPASFTRAPSSRSTATTFAPSARRRRHTSVPMPPATPVTTAVLPAMPLSTLSAHLPQLLELGRVIREADVVPGLVGDDAAYVVLRDDLRRQRCVAHGRQVVAVGEAGEAVDGPPAQLRGGEAGPREFGAVLDGLDVGGARRLAGDLHLRQAGRLQCGVDADGEVAEAEDRVAQLGIALEATDHALRGLGADVGGLLVDVGDGAGRAPLGHRRLEALHELAQDRVRRDAEHRDLGLAVAVGD